MFFLIGHRPEVPALEIKSIGFKELIADAETTDHPQFKPVVFSTVKGIALVIAIAVILTQDTRGVDRIIRSIHLVQDIRLDALDAAALPVRRISAQIDET